jgi:hypothetical protein
VTFLVSKLTKLTARCPLVSGLTQICWHVGTFASEGRALAGAS